MEAGQAENIECLAKRTGEVGDRVWISASDLLKRIKDVATQIARQRRRLVVLEELAGDFPHGLDQLVKISRAAVRLCLQRLTLWWRCRKATWVDERVRVATLAAFPRDVWARLALHPLWHVVHRWEQACRERLARRVHGCAGRRVNGQRAGRECNGQGCRCGQPPHRKQETTRVWGECVNEGESINWAR